MAAVENNYQVKGVFNRMKHAVHYFDQMESKVLQATNMDAWGAPSSLMRSIADGTKDTEKLNIIMPAIYRRFIVKETRLWLQVYKALVLLEYLIKYGDEQVLGYVKSNLNMFETLKTFEYIDEKGYDKGVNVRIRSKAIYDLVMDPEEVKKIRDNAALSQDRFIGVSSADVPSSSSINNENDDKTVSTTTENENSNNTTIANTNSPATLNVTTETKNTTTTFDDDMDNVIFREDFIDANHLEEDNHAIMNGEKILVKDKKKVHRKAKKMNINDEDDEDDEDEEDEDKEEEKEEKDKKENLEKEEEKVKDQSEVDDKKRKSKSRFSFASFFLSKSKQSLEIESNIEGEEEKKQEKELPKLDITTTAATATATATAATATAATATAATAATTIATTIANVAPNATATVVIKEDDEDGWGDFASPTNDDNLFNDENDLVNLNDIPEISPSQSSTRRTSSEETVLLDLNLVDISIMNYSSSVNQPIATPMKQEYTPSVPLTMQDFDPLNFSFNNNNIATANNSCSPQLYHSNNSPIQNKVHQSSYYTSHHQLAQPWSPWMATNSNQRNNATVDDLLS